MRNYLLLALVVIVLSCQDTKSKHTLKPGNYRAVLEVQDNKQLPFTFKVISPQSLEIYNANEVIGVDEISYKNDSVYIKMPVFAEYIVASIDDNHHLAGRFINPDRDRAVPFRAEFGKQKRFYPGTEAAHDISGVWEAVFSEGLPEDEYKGKGIFEQNGQNVTGTIRTATGDYRFLEGIVDGNTLKLSTFDGTHAFFFKAQLTDSTMEGTFYSGNHFKESFVAQRNPDFKLPAASDLTFIKEGYDRFNFSFPNIEGEQISLSDQRFEDKVVIVQIMGSWCPNCLDESRYFSQFYKEHADDDLEFVALAFEYAKTKASAFKRIQRLKTSIGIDYPILLAQYGSADKQAAQEKLPMLNQVLSYPTTIFIDKEGNVRKIHTGFNGPATGDKYLEFKDEFEDFVAELLAE